MIACDQSAPTLEAIQRPSRWLVLAQLSGCTLWAICAGFLFQLAVAGGASTRSPAGTTYFTTALLTSSQSISAALGVAIRNLVPWGVFTAAGIAIARVGERGASSNRTMAFQALPIVVTNLVCWWALAAQASSIAAREGESQMALLLRLPHGVLEFAALELPLIAAVFPRKLDVCDRRRHLVRSSALALLLLLSAAFVEVFISPVLFGIPEHP